MVSMRMSALRIAVLSMCFHLFQVDRLIAEDSDTWMGEKDPVNVRWGSLITKEEISLLDIEYFLGVVEGCVGCPPPAHWRADILAFVLTSRDGTPSGRTLVKEIQQAQASRRHEIRVDHGSLVFPEVPLSKGANGAFTYKPQQLELSGERLLLTDGSASIDVSAISRASGITIDAQEFVLARISRHGVLLGTHTGFLGDFQVTLADRVRGDEAELVSKWRRTIEVAPNKNEKYLGPSRHLVHVDETESLFVFWGIGSHACYCSTVKIADGNPVKSFFLQK